MQSISAFLSVFSVGYGVLIINGSFEKVIFSIGFMFVVFALSFTRVHAIPTISMGIMNMVCIEYFPEFFTVSAALTISVISIMSAFRAAQ